MELGQCFGAEFFGIDPQGGGEARELGEFHAALAALPAQDALGCDVEGFGDLRLGQVEFLAAPPDQDVQRLRSGGGIRIHMRLLVSMQQVKRDYSPGRISTWFNSQISSNL